MTRNRSLAFTVYGTPQPAGSKKAWVNRKTGRAHVSDANRKSKPWQSQVAQVAGEIMADREMFRGDIELTLHFHVQRPKGHFGKRGLLPSAPERPTKKPDVLKLARGVEDALSGIIYADDAQIVDEHLHKWYGDPERVDVIVTALQPTEVR